MRIAVYHNLPSGGGKRALYEMARRLAARHELDVFTLSSAEHDFGDLRPFARHQVIAPFTPWPMARSPFGRVNQLIRTMDLVRLRGVQRQVAARIDGNGYDVAFVHNCRFGQSPMVLQYLRTPSVYYCQEPPRQAYEPPVERPYDRSEGLRRALDAVDPLPGIYRRALTALDRESARSAGMVLANSCYSRESLYRTYGLLARVCYLGVDTQRFRPADGARGDYVVSVGYLNPRKGFDFAIRSLGLVRSAPRPRLVIVSNGGADSERRYLEGLAAKQGVEVEFRTLVSDEDLVAIYGGALLTLYAPIMEPFGLVALESMACGTPVVGIREAGVRETVVDGETGLLTERDEAEFAAAVTDLLRDAHTRERLGRQARAHVEANWTWERTVEALERHLSDGKAMGAAGRRA